MPDARLERTRATLSNGYQFGDAKQPQMSVVHCYDFETDRIIERLIPHVIPPYWNDVERGEH